ncbi:BRCT domain-containing protein [Iodobacter arcticus]|uniref:BRCT domain-containing protein n=1 Tax=Iodobacter arcticus TaxID=590593 RepID=A0ABW2QRJ0_9NEIS
MHPDHIPYAKYMTRSRLEKSINSLLGIVEGIAIDSSINASELSFLDLWLSEHSDLRGRHPYTELIPVIQAAIVDGVLAKDEHDDIVWLCEKLCSTEFFNKTTADLQRLHAILAGVVADEIISEAELYGLSAWLQEHEHLRTCWPYDEIDSLIIEVMRDKKIDEEEQVLLRCFFSEFIAIMDDRAIKFPIVIENQSVVGLCAVCPEIKFDGANFCFTGASSQYKRASLIAIVERLGGKVASSLTKEVQYLIIGANGNPFWAYACYGRKVEKAVELRKQGVRILLVHENDFHDAVADEG